MEQNRNFIYEEYIDVTEDDKGALQSIQFKNYDRFNFAFDIVDKLAQSQPDKLAMLHIAKNKRTRELTFDDMSKYSSKAAAYFQSLGIEKRGSGDAGFKAPLPILVRDPGSSQAGGGGDPGYQPDETARL